MEIKIVEQLRGLAGWLLEGPLWKAAQIMHRRFRDDHLGQAAGALTFTTIIALVPLCTVVLAMLTALDRYVAGNPHALALVRVPTEAQERQRSESRLRQSLKRDLKLLAQRGRGLALQYGHSLKGKWYGARNWPRLEVPSWLRELLKPLQATCAALQEQVRVQGEAIEAVSTGPLPKGLGRLSQQVMEREVGDGQQPVGA